MRAALPRGPGEPAATGIDPEALQAIGVDYDGIRVATEQTFGAGALESAPDRRFTDRRGRTRFMLLRPSRS